MRFLAAAGIILALLAAPAAAERVITVDVAGDLGELNRDLGGTTHGSNDANVIAALAEIAPPHIRIDVWFDVQITSPANPSPHYPYECVDDAEGRPIVDFSALDQRIANVRETGAEPLVIIDYMPPCLSRIPFRGPWDAQGSTRHPPLDYDRWEKLVHATVEHLVALDPPVTWFEAWNEPNLPQFFQGTLAEYLLIYDRIEKAVVAVEQETGRDLHLGGPAIAFPDPTWLESFLAFIVTGNRKLDFVSWHWYASYPLFGPVFTIPFVDLHVPPENVESPLIRPRDYADHTELVRNLVTVAWAGRTDGAPAPFLWLNEWNMNAGRDDRHDTSEAAGFTAAVLDQMLRAGLDRSSFFNVEDALPNFNQGMFFADGTPKPVYATWRFWKALRGIRVPALVEPAGVDALDGLDTLATGNDNLGAIATRSPNGKQVAILLYNWSPRAKRTEAVRVELSGGLGNVSGRLRALPPGAASGEDSAVLKSDVSGTSISFDLEDSSVALLRLKVD